MKQVYQSIDNKIFDTSEECERHENALQAMRYYLVSACPNLHSDRHEKTKKGILVVEPRSFRKDCSEVEAEEHIMDYLRYSCQKLYGSEYIMLGGDDLTPDVALIKNWVIDALTLDEYLQKIGEDVRTLGTIQRKAIVIK